MDCLTANINENDQFLTKLKSSDSVLNSFYQYDAMSPESFKEALNKPSNGREKALASIIGEYMSDLDLSDQQRESIDKLSRGAKVVIGGQQAGLFGGPLYTFHKILSIVNLSLQVEDEYQKEVVPVFWIAGEDHDFDEVNHTYVFNPKKAMLQKVKYHTMTPPESNVSRYTPDKEALIEALDQFMGQLQETEHTKVLHETMLSLIQKYETWTDIFKALLHTVFKDYGVLFIDAQDPKLRQLEQPILKEMLKQHGAVDNAFRQQQARTVEAGFSQMIQTDTNVHLFLHEEDMRQLLTFEDDKFYTSKSQTGYTEAELLEILEQEPERFSNNVVTRPIMEEWLFNTLSFIGGPSEIKYWAELKGAFDVLDVDMPIVLPRMKITYLTPRVEKLLNRYEINTEDVITNGIDDEKDKFIRAHASDNFLEQLDALQENQQEVYKQLLAEVKDNEDNKNLVIKNNQIHHTQYDYLRKRYFHNIERENAISMKHFREINDALHPMGGLQERIWNALQIMNDFGMDVFSPSTYPPLRYTLNQIIIKP
ncbi:MULTISPECIES: bacillithiol biosynthesis cysteine-adding enzyme BshC [Staphylococcus]|uniref:bacillithiol biosynthesis cysteine-adding enzyme BshC n=1 Tax=Staphylococcus TaxID=1279 RepID=UPI0008A28DF8|nr:MULTISPECIES: bacillithiol biosynthesis cysteine-adding enzyme BshC [Staphylococcus]MDT4012280.1 bacillithiol biosynthesis cysteine-adding enzyme BshC [Staphylococcus simulans]OFJ76729.1 bacillithiol biosynthesis cysteine-adding enzyme BshC [Staphylococcus sp. HMSC056G08]